MRLLYAKNITFDELPHIESALLAVSKVKSMYRDLFSAIINLSNMLTDCGRPGNKSEDAPRWQLARLIERIKSYEVMLVLNYYEKPMIPLFTLQADASHPRGGTWQVTDRRDLGASRLAILLRNMRPSHRSLVQAALGEHGTPAMVIVTGCTTSGCVRATTVDSFSNGFRTLVPEDCVGDHDSEPHEDNLRDVERRYADITTADEAIRQIDLWRGRNANR